MTQLIDYILHVDKHLQGFAEQHRTAIYMLLFAIVFCETGLVVTPFLPGDSLLFAVGALAAQGLLRIELIIPLLMAAAILGDNLNYWIGRRSGAWMVTRPWFKRDYLTKTEHFFVKHGGRAIIIARFVPIVRTFAPFMAGVGAMRYTVFLAYSLGGGALWIGGFVTAGYLFGGLPIVEKYFTLAILAIIAVSLLPAVYHFAQHKLQARRRAAVQADERS